MNKEEVFDWLTEALRYSADEADAAISKSEIHGRHLLPRHLVVHEDGTWKALALPLSQENATRYLGVRPGTTVEAICITEDGDWDGVAARIGARLVNRASAPGADPVTHLLIPATGHPEEGSAMAEAAWQAFMLVAEPGRSRLFTQNEMDAVAAAVAEAMPWIRADERRRIAAQPGMVAERVRAGTVDGVADVLDSAAETIQADR
jgi:hypothetical protein